jgi:hypothetical protein
MVQCTSELAPVFTDFVIPFLIFYSFFMLAFWGYLKFNGRG